MSGAMIYKIFRQAEWADFQAKGQTKGAPIDLADGFIHFSTAGQVRETAAKHFAGQDDLVLAAIEDSTVVDALTWEISRNDQLFPHLFRALHQGDVSWCIPLKLGADGHIFPDDLK